QDTPPFPHDALPISNDRDRSKQGLPDQLLKLGSLCLTGSRPGVDLAGKQNLTDRVWESRGIKAEALLSIVVWSAIVMIADLILRSEEHTSELQSRGH